MISYLLMIKKTSRKNIEVSFAINIKGPFFTNYPKPQKKDPRLGEPLGMIYKKLSIIFQLP